MSNMEKIRLVGTFKNNKSFGFVIPDNKKESKDIFISKKYFIQRCLDKI